MRSTQLTLLCIFAALAMPAVAQDTTAPAEEVLEETTEDTMADDTMSEPADGDAMAEDVMTDDADTMSDDTMADDAEVMEDDTMAEDTMAEEAATPDLEAIAAADPNLDVTTNEDGEVDAMVMLSDVLFPFGQATLGDGALETLRGVADKLDGVTAIEITGHTDAIGSEAFNEALGQQRADAVRDWLIANTALTADVITARGVGETDPIAPNTTEDGADNPDGRALNRRVEFTLPDAEG